MKIATLDRLDWSSHQAAADGFWRMRMTASNGTVTEDHPCQRYGTDAKIIQLRYAIRFASLGYLQLAAGGMCCGLLIADKIDLTGKGPASLPTGYGSQQQSCRIHRGGTLTASTRISTPACIAPLYPIRFLSIIPSPRLRHLFAVAGAKNTTGDAAPPFVTERRYPCELPASAE